MSDIAIKVEHLSKKYSIGSKSSGSLRETLVQKWNSISNKTKSNEQEFWALNDISFEVKQGEVLGIIGKNGAGKSTLLKVLSRITEPTSGRFIINGRVSSLLEVGTGFHPELTGRENIYLNGTILGMTRREVKQKFDEIIDFSGVEKFIDTPVKHYSSGMYVRLAFAVAANLEPEILIIDEVLAVGDAEFQKKCLGKMKDVAGEGRTVLFVSHNLAALNTICQRGILIENGKAIFNGTIKDAISKYTSSNSSEYSQSINLSSFKRERGLKKITFQELTFNESVYFPNSCFEVSLKLELRNKTFTPEFLNFGFHIVDQYENQIFHLSNLFCQKERAPYKPDGIYSFKLNQLNLKQGIYNIWLWLEANGEEQDFISSGICFEVQNGNIYNYTNSSIISGAVQPEFSFFNL